MKKCICILILFSEFAQSAEHTIVHGDNLWSLSKRYLGSSSKWREIVYEGGALPNELDLNVGRKLVFPSITPSLQKVKTTKVKNSSIPFDYISTSETEAGSIFSPRKTLSFNKSLYCCAANTIVMDENGSFEVGQQSHPFYVQKAPNVESKMASFMNIKISEDLLNAFDKN